MTITIGELTARPGEKTTGFLKPVQWYDGSYCKVPLAIVNGAKDGPTLWIQCASHGNEYQGMAATQRLIKETDPADLSGALILVPVLNIIAFNAQLRSSPVDGLDYNRNYPGAPPEKVMHILGHTEAIIHTMVQEIQAHADAIIDTHDAGPLGDDTEIFYCTSPDEAVTRRTRAMAFSTGNPVIREITLSNPEDRRKYPGMLGTAINHIPNITVEVGGGCSINEGYAAEVHRQYTNVMKHLGILPGEPQIDGEPTFLNSTAMVRPRHGGILRMRIKVHQRVVKGEVLGEITDFFGNVVEELKSPIDGLIYAFRNAAVVATGQWCVSLGGVAPKPEF